MWRSEKKSGTKNRTAPTKIRIAMERVFFMPHAVHTHTHDNDDAGYVVGALEARTCLLCIFVKHLTSQTVL